MSRYNQPNSSYILSDTRFGVFINEADDLLHQFAWPQESSSHLLRESKRKKELQGVKDYALATSEVTLRVGLTHPAS